MGITRYAENNSPQSASHHSQFQKAFSQVKALIRAFFILTQHVGFSHFGIHYLPKRRRQRQIPEKTALPTPGKLGRKGKLDYISCSKAGFHFHFRPQPKHKEPNDPMFYFHSSLKQKKDGNKIDPNQKQTPTTGGQYLSERGKHRRQGT